MYFTSPCSRERVLMTVEGPTLVEGILILLALPPAAGSVVDLIHETPSGRGRLALAVFAFALVGSAGELVDEIHDGWVDSVRRDYREQVFESGERSGKLREGKGLLCKGEGRRGGIVRYLHTRGPLGAPSPTEVSIQLGGKELMDETNSPAESPAS